MKAEKPNRVIFVGGMHYSHTSGLLLKHGLNSANLDCASMIVIAKSGIAKKIAAVVCTRPFSHGPEFTREQTSNGVATGPVLLEYLKPLMPRATFILFAGERPQDREVEGDAPSSTKSGITHIGNEREVLPGALAEIIIRELRLDGKLPPAESELYT